MEIKWNPIAGFPDYVISNYGEIKALEKTREGRLDMLNGHSHSTEKSKRVYREHTIKPKLTNGYLYVQLTNTHGSKWLRVHRLVYLSFVGDIPNNMVVDHIDGNKTNNCVCNLRCVTPSTNKTNPNTRFNGRKAVLQIDPITKQVIAEYKSAKDAELHLGVADVKGKVSHIPCVCKGKRRTALGFMWKYKE